MKTLGHVQDVAEIRSRLLALTGEDQPQWGVMNVTQMVCHLREPYLFALSPEPGIQVKLAVPPKVAKNLVLGPLARWPKNLPTLAEFRIGGSLMATRSFAEDHASLLEAFDRFCAVPSLTKGHPFFTTMEHDDWMLWGYRHADHHLRQFGR